MNILQICYCYPPFFSGYGKQLHTVNQAIIKRSAKFNITVLTAYGKNRSVAYSEKLSVRATFKKEKKKGRIHFALFCILAPLRWIKLFYSADVVHIVKAGPEVILPVFIAKILQKKTIVKVAQDDLESLIGDRISWMRKIRRFCLRRVDVMVAISAKIEQDMISIGVSERNIVRIPNCVDFNRFYCESEKIERPSKRYIFVGAISKRKGVEDILEALSSYRGDLICFDFVGPIYDVNNFIDRISKLNERYVLASYHGASSSPETFMRKSDCLVLPSYSEGMPNVVLEAMACGLFVIASDIDVHKEICRSGMGRVFKLGDTSALAREIMCFNKEKYGFIEKEINSGNTRQMYSVDRISDRYIDIYQSKSEVFSQ